MLKLGVNFDSAKITTGCVMYVSYFVFCQYFVGGNIQSAPFRRKAWNYWKYTGIIILKTTEVVDIFFKLLGKQSSAMKNQR